MRPASSSFKLFLLILLYLPMFVFAQVYSWKDANGKIHYGDRPPAEKQANGRKLAAPPGETSDAAALRQSAAESKMAEREKTQKETRQTGEDPAQAKIREDNCREARISLAGLESGQIRFKLDASGERVALDGEVREAELAKARKIVDSWCTPPRR